MNVGSLQLGTVWQFNSLRTGKSHSLTEKSSLMRHHFREETLKLQKSRSKIVPDGGFLKWGYPQTSSIFGWDFPLINHPAMGVPPFLEPHSIAH